MLKYIALVAFLAGCGTMAAGVDSTLNAIEVHRGQADAVDLVWHTMLGMDGDAPTVAWVKAEPCKNLPDPAFNAVTVSGPACLVGAYASGHIRLVDVDAPMSQTSIAHELFHAFLHRTTGDADGAHANSGWAYVHDMQSQLAAAGL